MTCTELDEEILMDKEYRRKIATGEAGRSTRGVRPELPENPLSLGKSTDYGHPERAFFQKSQTYGLGQTFCAEMF